MEKIKQVLVSKQFIAFIVLILVIVVTSETVYIALRPTVKYIYRDSKTRSIEEINDSKKTPEIIIEGQIPTPQFIYTNEKKLFARLSNRQSLKIGGYTGTAYAFSASQNLKTIALLTSRGGGDQQNYPREIFAISLSTGEAKKIYELSRKTIQIDFENSDSDISDIPLSMDELKEFYIGISDISMSPDGTTVAICTTDSLYTYNLTSDALTTVFSNPVTKISKDTSTGCKAPIFSLNNRYILFTDKFLGKSQIQAVADTISKIVINISDTTNNENFDKVVVGWKDNTTLYVIKDIIDLQTLKQTTTLATETLNSPGVLTELYTISDLKFQTAVTSPSKLCVAGDTKRPAGGKDNKLYCYDALTNKTELVDNRYDSTSKFFASAIRVLGDNVFVQLQSWWTDTYRNDVWMFNLKNIGIKDAYEETLDDASLVPTR